MTETDSEQLDERRALGIVQALTDHDEAGCSDCGATVDVSEAETPDDVSRTLEQHRQRHGDSE